MAGPAALINDLYDKLLGGTNPSEAASSTGDIAAMIKYIAANIPGAVPTPVNITPWSGVSGGAEIAAYATAVPASAVYPSALRGIYVPFRVSQTAPARMMWAFNGTVVSGNLDLGIYSEDANGLPGTKLVGKGSPAQAGVTGKQELDIADTVLQPGRYYMAIVLDNTTGTFSSIVALLSCALGIGIMTETIGAMPLPATASPVTAGYGYIPVFGLSLRTVI